MNKEIDLSHSKLTNKDLKKLATESHVFQEAVVIDLSHNKLTKLPYCAGEWKVEKLILTGNRIIKIPKNLWGKCYDSKNKCASFMYSEEMQQELHNHGYFKISKMLCKRHKKISYITFACVYGVIAISTIWTGIPGIIFICIGTVVIIKFVTRKVVERILNRME